MEVRLYDSTRDAVKLQKFNEHIYGVSSRLNTQRSNSAKTTNPYGQTPGPTALAIIDDAVVGQLISTPFGLWSEGQEKLAYWLSGFHVLPNTRGMGVGKKLVACLTQTLPTLSAVVVVEPSLKAFLANRWIYPGKIIEYIHIVNPRTLSTLLTRERLHRFLPGPLKPFSCPLLSLSYIPARIAISLLKRMKRVSWQVTRGSNLGFKDVEDFGRDIDRLWEKTKKKLTLTHTRNSQYINWMFPAQRGWKKSTRTNTNGEVTAWLLYVIKSYKDGGPMDGFKALNIIDSLWDMENPQEILDLVSHILWLGKLNNVDLILVSGNNKSLQGALKQAAFIKIPSTVYVGFHEGQSTDNFLPIFKKSYITRGYADAAGGLGPS